MSDIKERVIDGIITYNHDCSTVLNETYDGELLDAKMGEGYTEYTAEDSLGRDVVVGQLGDDGDVILEEEYELVSE